MVIEGHVTSLLLLSTAFAVAGAIRALKEGLVIDADGRIFKSAAGGSNTELLSTPQSSDESSVRVHCNEVSMIVEVNADLYKNGHLVSPGDLFLGKASSEKSQCRAVAVSDSEYVIEAGLQDCGFKLSISEDSVIYSNKLIYSPAASYHGITRRTHAAVPVSCHYKRTHLVSSSMKQQHQQSPPPPPPPTPPLTFTPPTQQYSEGHSSFLLKLMTEDWTRERSSTVFYLGDFIHLQASYAGPDAQQRRLFIDSCVATLTPDTTSVPRYYFIENHGCVTDGKLKGSKTLFKPRKTFDSLQLQLDAFLFHRDPRNSIFITCQLKATSDMWKSSPINKACNYEHLRWKNVDGNIGVCQCCDSMCHERSFRDMTICDSVTLGPLMTFPTKVGREQISGQ